MDVFLFSVFFLSLLTIYIRIRLHLCLEGVRRVGRGTGGKKTGPNDTRRVIWALGMSFLLLSSHFLHAN